MEKAEHDASQRSTSVRLNLRPSSTGSNARHAPVLMLVEKASSVLLTWSQIARAMRLWLAAKRRAVGAKKDGRDVVVTSTPCT